MPNQTPYLQMQAGYGLAPKAVTSGSLDGQGLFDLAIDASPPAGGVLLLADGLSLRGLKLTENAINFNTASDAICTSVLVRCPSGSATIVHEDTGVSTANCRFRVELTAANLTITPGMLVQLLYDHTAQRWGVNVIAEAHPVTSVNGQTGAVSLDAGDVGADASGTGATEAASAVGAHVGESDPHPQYTTAAEAASAAPVQSVNGSTGVVVLDATDVGADASGTASSAVAAHEAASDPHPAYTTAVEAAAAAPVQSVNDYTGAVVLDADDVGADAEGTAAAAVAAHEGASNPHPQYARALYSGTTSGSGTYSVTYSSAYASTPIVVVQLVGGSNNPNQFVRLTSSTASGFTVTAYQQSIVSLLGIDVVAGAAAPVNGLAVNVVVLPT